MGKKHTGGRPPRYKSREELEEKIEAYFTSCEGEVVIDEETGNPMLDKWGRLVYMGRKPPTVTGLALALGFATRASLLDYQAKPEYQDLILKAKTRIEQYAEERLYDRDGCMGARFNLQNNFRGWKDSPKDGAADDALKNAREILGGIHSAIN